MKFNFPIAERWREKKSTFNDHKKLGYKSLTGLRVSVCQITKKDGGDIIPSVET